MPNLEPIALEARSYTLRHVGPLADVWPSPSIAAVSYVVLNQPAMVGRPLPMSNQPNSQDFATGQWTRRLIDAGDFSLTFPNKEASDGPLWRNRFSAAFRNQWVSIWNDEYLEFNGAIEKIDTKRDQVVISGHDGMFQTKFAYERDWITVQAPRDVLERGTQVWVPITCDDFAYNGTNIPSAQWTAATTQQTGFQKPSTVANDTSNNPYSGQTGYLGVISWANPTNVQTEVGNATAAVTGPVAASSFYGTYGLKATGYGFSIPSNATIVGIEVKLTSGNTSSTSSWSAGSQSPGLVIGGTFITSSRPSFGPAPSTSFPFGSFSANTSSTGVWGAANDLWQTSGITVAQANASNFGWEIAADLGVYDAGTLTATVQAMEMNVYYSLPSGTGAQINSAGGLVLSAPNIASAAASITSTAKPCTSPIWRCELAIQQITQPTGTLTLTITEGVYQTAQLVITDQQTGTLIDPQGLPANSGTITGQGIFGLAALSSPVGQVPVSAQPSYSSMIESDGEWIWGYVNGRFVGGFRRHMMPFNPGTIQTAITLTQGSSPTSAIQAILTGVLTEAQVPFLLHSATRRYNDLSHASTAVNNSGTGTVAWTNPGNVTSGSAPAQAALSSGQTSNWIYATNFGFNVPSNAIITGIQAVVNKSQSNSTGAAVTDNVVELIYSGSGISSNKALSGTWVVGNLTQGYPHLYGQGFADLWGTGNLTPTIVNDPSFGLAINVGLSSPTGGIQYNAYIFAPVQLIIYYHVIGVDNGDYVLPGDVSTYPWGGLHGRYYNNADISSDGHIADKMHHPSRSQAFAGASGVPEYNNRQDSTVDWSGGGFAPEPGVASDGTNQVWFSTIWFGAVYLRLSQGNYAFSFAVDDGVRVWVGKTQWGDQIIDAWISEGTTTYTVPISAAELGGKDGWYPIKIEYFNGISGSAAQLFFTPPVTYTDPGGTSLVSGVSTIIPATSLSPLGCVDQRHQGLSHFDLIQQNAQAFGYQCSTEPKSLESGEFPGRLTPHIREGTDYDVTLEPDDSARRDGMINYGNVLDGTDCATSVTGNGAGFQNGSSGQLQERVYDCASLVQALFDLQAWQDYSDAAFASLLHALLNGLLGQKLNPWQIITGDPIGRYRLANTWPLPSSLIPFRWLPGDAVRVQAPDVSVFDTSPRQLLLVTRQIHPNGSTSVQVGFAARPRSSDHQLRQSMFGATRWSRNYQRQQITLSGNYLDAQVVAANSTGNYSIIPLRQGDQLIRAQLSIAYLIGTSPSVGLSFINSDGTIDATNILNGPWSFTPIVIDVTPVATPDTYDRLCAAIINKSASNAVTVSFQLIVTVLR